MKKNSFIIATIMLFTISSVTTSCSKDDKTVAPGITVAEVTTIITASTWNVTHYDEAGIDHTSDFSGYAFAFNADKTLVATETTLTKNGTWNSTSESGKVKITIDFTATETKGSFESISEDWKVLTAVDSEITLQHISDDKSIDLLTITKN
jgi:hypothetical protein